MYHWAVTFIAQDTEIINNANSFFTTLLSAEGGYFTLTLAVVYLPAAYILQRHADVLIESEKDETVRQEMQKKYNFNFSFLESLPRLLAILGPLLAGSVGELIVRISQNAK